METSRFVDPEPGALVQRFSWEMEAQQRTEADTVEYAQLRSDFLWEKDRREREKQRSIERLEEMFSSTRSDDVMVFNKAKKQLLESMRKFQDLVPGPKGSDIPTCWGDVVSATFEVQAKWEAKAKDTRVGRAKELVRKMCNGMNNHATALKMLPTESEYVSVIGGSVLMIIKASANHINISEAFAMGMIEINDAVRLENLSHVYDTPVLSQLTMRLYAHIFCYLIKFMTWHTDSSITRFRKSFNENSLRLFEEDLGQVKQVSSLLSRQIQLHMSADVHVSKLMLEDLSGDLRYLIKFSEVEERHSKVRDAANAELLRNVLRCQLEKTKDELKECLLGIMGAYGERIRCGVSGNTMADLLEQQVTGQVRAIGQSPDAHADKNTETENTPSGRQSGSVSGIMEPPQDIDIRFESRHLEDYFDWEHAHPPTQAPAPVLADASFVAGLNLFTTTLKSQVLYAHGSYQTHGPDLLQQSTSVYKSLAEEAGVAVVSYFCELSNADPPANRSRESMELSALLCALIRQLVNLLPSGGSEQAARLDPSRFAVLDGTLRTYKEALSLIEDLARCVRLPMMLFIIHGLNILEEEAGNTIIEVLEDLVNCFVRMANPVSTDEEGIVKVLFTSSGLSDVLCNLINEEDMVACDSSTPGGGKRARRGRQVLSY